MTPEKALEFIDMAADGGLGAPDYAEARSILAEALRRIPKLEDALAVSRIYVGQIVEDVRGGSFEQQQLAKAHLDLINELVP